MLYEEVCTGAKRGELRIGTYVVGFNSALSKDERMDLLASFDCNAKVLLYLKSILETHFTGFEAVLLIALSLFLSQYVFRITSLFLRQLSANFTQLVLCSLTTVSSAIVTRITTAKVLEIVQT